MKAFLCLVMFVGLAACGRGPEPVATTGNSGNMVSAEQAPGDVIVPPDETAGDNAGSAANAAD